MRVSSGSTGRRPTGGIDTTYPRRAAPPVINPAGAKAGFARKPSKQAEPERAPNRAEVSAEPVDNRRGPAGRYLSNRSKKPRLGATFDLKLSIICLKLP